MFSGSIPNLINGVSRQVDAMRLPTHVEEQINRFSAPATGNQRRPGTDHVALVSGSFSGDHFYHPINRDADERYHVLIRNGDLFVLGADGSQKTVAFPDGKSYLNVAKPSEQFSAATSADFTFIANKTQVIGFTPDVEPVRTSEALIFVRSANLSKEYSVWVNGVRVAAFTTGDGIGDATGNSENRNASPAKIAQALLFGTATTGTVGGHTVTDGDASLGFGDQIVSAVLANNLPSSAWTLRRYNNVIHIIRNDNAPFTVRVESNVVNDKQSIIAIRNSVQAFSDLPNNAPEGYVVRVDSEPSSDEEDYWVKATKDAGNDDNGEVVWKECAKPGVNLALNPATMPHVLVRESNGSFTFRRATWAQRKAGDTEYDPSFVGGTINDIIFNRGRMAVLTNESVVMTRPSEFFDFWRTTLTTVLDDDPIDVAGTSDNVAIFRHGVAFNEDLFLFANQSVHRLTSGELLTPSRVALPPAATGSVNVTVPPIATTRSILFLSTALTYADVREVFIAGDTEEAINASVSDHVPGYLPKTINRLVSSDSTNMAIVTAPGIGAPLYVYQFYWAGNEKLQAAWHKWVFDANAEVIGSAFWDDVLHLVLRRGTTLWVEKMFCGAELFDEGKDWMIRLDRRVLSSSLGAPIASGTLRTYTLPYNAAGVVCLAWGGDAHGLPVTITSRSSNTITVNSNGQPVVFGFAFSSSLVLSRLHMRDSDDKIMQSSPFRLRRLYVHLSKTAYCKACVQPYSNGPILYKHYTPRVLNDASSFPDRVVFGSGAFSVPVKARTDRVKIWMENDGPYPDVITGLEWEGDYDIRARMT